MQGRNKPPRQLQAGGGSGSLGLGLGRTHSAHIWQGPQEISPSAVDFYSMFSLRPLCLSASTVPRSDRILSRLLSLLTHTQSLFYHSQHADGELLLLDYDM